MDTIKLAQHIRLFHGRKTHAQRKARYVRPSYLWAIVATTRLYAELMPYKPNK